MSALSWGTHSPDSESSQASTSRIPIPHGRRSRRTPRASRSVLSALAAVVGLPSSSSGTPVTSRPPPTFLCPFLGSEEFLSEVSSTPTLKVHARGGPPIPSKYSPGNDGEWGPVGQAYTLYGSTICPTCEPTPTATATSTATQPTFTSSLPAATTVTSHTTSTPDIVDSLPKGWKPTHINRKLNPNTILGLSIGLAILIFVFIWAIVFFRRQRRKLRRIKDAEAKRSTSSLVAEQELKRVEKEMAARQKLWAKATAKWKSRARYTLRQRGGKRVVSSVQSVAASPNASSDHLPLPEDEPTQPSTPTAPTPTPVPPPPDLPDYDLTSVTEDSDSAHPTSLTRTLPALTAAHVATDDKTVLARLANMATAPPPDDSIDADAEAQPSSVPQWVDEEFDPSEDLGEGCSSVFTPCALFPAPPSKQQLATRHLFDDDYIETLEPEPGPSAPPFEENSGEEVVASAPPLPFDDDEQTSAPPLSDPSFEEPPTYADRGRST